MTVRMGMALLVTAGIILGLCAKGARSEPAYEGKPLSYWVDHLAGTEFARSYDAIRDIGPDAVPWLLQRVKAANGVWHRTYSAVFEFAPLSLRQRLTPPIPLPRLEEKMAYALSLLEAKGAPQIARACRHHNPGVRRVAALAAGRMLMRDEILSQIVPELGKLLADVDPSVRLAAALALETLEDGAAVATPALIRASRGFGSTADPKFQSAVVRALGRIGPQAVDAAPVLASLTRSPLRDVRIQAAMAFWRTTGETKSLPLLIAELEQGGLMPQYQEMLQVLTEIGPAAKAVVPTLMARLRHPGFNTVTSPEFSATLTALRMIDPPAAMIIEKEQDSARLAAYIKSVQDPHHFLRTIVR